MYLLFVAADGLRFVCLQQEREAPSNYGLWFIIIVNYFLQITHLFYVLFTLIY